MKKKLRGALALVLSALMMLAPITGASAAQTHNMRWISAAGYRVSHWSGNNADSLYQSYWSEDLFSGDVVSSDTKLGLGDFYAGESIIRYWDGDGYGSGTPETVRISSYNSIYTGLSVADGMWRAVNAEEKNRGGYLDLEAVGAVVSGYPKAQGDQKLYMFEGVNTQTYAQVTSRKSNDSDFVDEDYIFFPLSASKIRAQFKNMYPSMAMNFYEAALYGEITYEKCADTKGEMAEYTVLREMTPEKAVELVFPYPQGYSKESDPADIKVLHAVEEKRVLKEEITYPYEGVIYTNTVTESSAKFVEEQFTLEADGIHVKTQTLSPFAVAYVSSEQPPVEDQQNEDVKGADLPRTGDSSMLMLWVGLMSASVVALFAARRRRA